MQNKIYPNTKEGALAMLKADSQGLNISSQNIASILRDSSVAGVWKVSLKDGMRVICYLAGYQDATGSKRLSNDFEVGSIA
jgi:hypothetical protein